MQARASTMRGDVISAYAAAGARIASWAFVSAMVYRDGGAAAFAVLAFVRGTIGILNYTSLGLGPAMIRLLSEAQQARTVATLIPETPRPVGNGTGILAYARATDVDAVRTVYMSGFLYSLIALVLGVTVIAIYTAWAQHTQISKVSIPGNASLLIIYMSGGMLMRILGDAPSAILQTSGRIQLDNIISALGEFLWPAFIVTMWDHSAVTAALAFLLSSTIALCARVVAINLGTGILRGWRREDFSWTVLKHLFSMGILITAAQLADYLYAPTDYILINWLLGALPVAAYAPAVQIDAAMLVMVGGLASVLLPKTALAHTAGDTHAVRRYYVLGTLWSAAMLTTAALVILLFSRMLFRIWLGEEMRATQFILPWVMIHTVVGGSSAVGRSILLGMGKVKPFTIAVLVAGIGNVILSYCFVKYLGLGLKGIILGTIVVVVARCAIWMPWYILRTLRAGTSGGEPSVEAAPVITPVV